MASYFNVQPLIATHITGLGFLGNFPIPSLVPTNWSDASRWTVVSAEGTMGRDRKERRSVMKHLTCVVSLFLLFGMAAGAWAGEHEEIASNRQQSLQALQAGNIEALSAMYAEDAHYTPATSPFRREGREEIRAFWAGFLQASSARRLTLRQVSVRVYGTTAVETGYFDFTGMDRAGTVTNISGRYSTTWVKLGGKWMVVDQHVSQLPFASVSQTRSEPPPTPPLPGHFVLPYGIGP